MSVTADHPEAPLSTAAWARRGLRAALDAPGLVLFANFIGFGGLLYAVGFPIWAGVASTFLVWALPAQVILIGGLASGTSLPAIALAVGLSSLRLLPMAVSLAPYLRGRRRNMVLEFACAHYVAMTLWVEGLRLLPKMPAEGRVPFALGYGNGLVGLSMLGTYAGYQLAGQLPGPLAAGLLIMTPLSFVILMVRGAREATDWIALAAGIVLTPLVLNLSGGLDLMVAGVGGGTLAYLAGRRWRAGR